MRRMSSGPPAPADPPGTPRSDWSTLKKLLPFLWQYRVRVVLALGFLVAAKVANVGVPLLLKELVDAMTVPVGDPRALLVVPVGLLLAYGALRLSTTLFTELRELIFAKATEGAARSISLQAFRHLHALSLRFHLERQTGGMTRDIERGTRAVQSLFSYSLYSIIPTLIEVTLVLSLLAIKFDMAFAWITLAALAVGDIPASPAHERLAERIAATLPGLLGPVGVDFVDTDDGPVVVEINPRMSTSACALRDATGINLIAATLDALRRGRLPQPATPRPQRIVLAPAREAA